MLLLSLIFYDGISRASASGVRNNGNMSAVLSPNYFELLRSLVSMFVEDIL